MQSHHAGILLSEHVADAVPDVAALSRFRRSQIRGFQFFMQGLQAGAIVPQNLKRLIEVFEIVQGEAVFLLIRPV